MKVLSLNLAHGRGNSLNQLLVGDAAIRANLARIAETLIRAGADIAALQEADGPSRWSGGFDHVAHLAELAGYPVAFRGSHAESWLFDYGTALLSKRPLEDPLSFRFAPSPPTAGKGFVLAELRWPGGDIVSVHLDFSRASVRKAQVDELMRVLSARDHPVILAGDFNAAWEEPNSPLRRLTDEGGQRTTGVARPSRWQPARDRHEFGADK